MKVAISADTPSLDGNIDPRFGRCAYFLIVDTNSDVMEALENDNAGLPQGAGIQSAQLVASHGAKKVLTGHCGPKAEQALSAAGVEIVAGCSGTAREALEQLESGNPGTAEKVSTAVRDDGSFRPGAGRTGGGGGRGPCGGGMQQRRGGGGRGGGGRAASGRGHGRGRRGSGRRNA